MAEQQLLKITSRTANTLTGQRQHRFTGQIQEIEVKEKQFRERYHGTWGNGRAMDCQGWNLWNREQKLFEEI